jgi:hypothetical protein
MDRFIDVEGKKIKYRPVISINYDKSKKNFLSFKEENLPLEIVFEIFSYSNEFDLLQLNLVNRSFKYFSENEKLWERLHMLKNKNEIYWPLHYKRESETWRKYFIRLLKLKKRTKSIWEKIELFLSKSAFLSLNGPASKTDILELEFIFKIPLEIGFSLAIHNGSLNSSDETFGVLGEYKFSPIYEMLEGFQILKERNFIGYLPLSDYFQNYKLYVTDKEGRIYLMDHGGDLTFMNNNWMEYLCNLIDATYIE